MRFVIRRLARSDSRSRFLRPMLWLFRLTFQGLSRPLAGAMQTGSPLSGARVHIWAATACG